MIDPVHRLIPLQSFARISGNTAVLIDEKGDLIGQDPLYFADGALANDVAFTTMIKGEPISFINTRVELDEPSLATYHELARTFKESGKPSFATAAAYKILSESTDGKNPIKRPPLEMELEPPHL
ncbi:hypothetical protein [Spirosoma panaciterrae]|uniref:hypothetical protein n=1 Tax=Spirosoma panaciterrae TaxID=496058 RepID=UPI0003610855|nr:hypothetical protein [Spirosoma panaciterrae]